MAFARPRPRVARARNFIVGVIVVSAFLFSQTWKSIAHHEATWWAITRGDVDDHTDRSLVATIEAAPASPTTIAELQDVGREIENSANKNTAALVSSSTAGSFRCASRLTTNFANLAAAGSQNGKRVMLTMLSNNQLEFSRSWLTSVREAGIENILVGAMDDESALELEKERVPCFMHPVSENVEALGVAWGQEGWRILTWQQVFVIKDLVDWGFDVLVTDIDVAWIHDPWPLFDRHPEADILFSQDGLTSRNERPKEEDLELAGSAHYNLNTGIYILRSSNATRAFLSEWAANFKNSNQHDQAAMYALLRKGGEEERKGVITDPGLKPAFNNKLLIGIVPVYLFSNGHSYTVSRLHEILNTGEPLAVHAVWTMSGKDGKISRLREAMLWHDSKEYYSNGNFVTVDLQVPEMPNNFNEIQENEPMIKFHLDALQMQLEQLTVALSIATATGRIFIMPKLVCFCETGWYPGVRCRLADSDKLQFPIAPCPADYYFKMDQLNFDGKESSSGEDTLPPFSVREYSFLENSRTDVGIKNSQVRLSFTQSEGKVLPLNNNPGKNEVVEVAAGLLDKELHAELVSIESMRVWRLDFSQLKTPWDAFAGFKCKSKALQFEERANRILQDWCCRFKEEAEKYNTTEKVKLHAIPSGREFSLNPETDRC